MSIFSMISLSVAPLFYGLLEWVEVDDDQVDAGDFVALQLGLVPGFVPAGQDASVHLGVEGFDPASQDGRIAGHVGDFVHFSTELLNIRSCAPSRVDVYAQLFELQDDRFQSLFVEYRYQCRLNAGVFTHNFNKKPKLKRMPQQ
jgi:hypothetical protein